MLQKENYIQLKKIRSEDKKEIFKTGGGSYTPQLSIAQEQMLAVLDKQIRPLTNPFDDNALYHDAELVLNNSREVPVVVEANASQQPQMDAQVNDVIALQPAVPTTACKRKKKVNNKISAEQYKKMYFKKKYELAKFQLFAAKKELKPTIDLKKKKLEYIDNKLKLLKQSNFIELS